MFTSEWNYFESEFFEHIKCQGAGPLKPASNFSFNDNRARYRYSNKAVTIKPTVILCV